MNETKLFAVTGNPVLHSKSPCMFNAFFDTSASRATYFRLAACSAREAVAVFKSLQLKGMNVTAPFKEDILPLLDELSDEARAIGGVNTVVNHNGCLVGYNTDYVGVYRSLLHSGEKLAGRRCVVIGAGGAGKAAAYGLCLNGAHVTIVNRTIEKAKEAAAKLGCEFAGLHSLHDVMKQSDIIVFSLSQRINPVDPSWLLPHHVVFDANYKSSEFSEAARSAGCKIIEGLDWLLFQAIEAFQVFEGQLPDEHVMRAGLTTYKLSDKQEKIALVGFMGSGKTTVGKKLARKIDARFIDTDELIVEQEGVSIPEIFATKGEPYFRQVEKRVLENVMALPGKHIISCGGGLLLNESNREIVKNNCLVLWLYASPESTIKRIKPGSRPLLDVDNPLEKAKTIFNERKFIYASAADMLVNTEIFHPDEITEKIYEEISKTFGS